MEFDSASGPQRAVVWLPSGRAVDDLEFGREISVIGRLRPARPPKNPGDFDEQRALEATGCAWVMHARVVSVSSAPGSVFNWPWVWAQRARLSAESAYWRRLPAEHAALLAGLFLGDSGGVSRELAGDIRAAGATHLLVASGSNVGFVAGLTASLALLLRLRPAARAAAALAGAGFYTLMVGADPPCMRAWIMLAAALSSRVLGRDTPPSALLTLAAAVLLTAAPTGALSLSAAMSFGACLAVIWASRIVGLYVPAHWPRFVKASVFLAAASPAVSVALWPVWAEAFGQVSLSGPLANLALVPLSGPLLAGGFALWTVDASLPWLAPPLARAVDAGLSVFQSLCERAAGVSWAVLQTPPWNTFQIAAWALVVGAVVLFQRRRARLLMIAGAALCLTVDACRPRDPISILLLAGGGSLLRFNGGPAWFFGAKPPNAAARRAALAVGSGGFAQVAVGGPWSIYLGKHAIRFDGARGPAVRRGQGAFAIMPPPRATALEITTDGENLHVEEPLRPDVRRGLDFLQ